MCVWRTLILVLAGVILGFAVLLPGNACHPYYYTQGHLYIADYSSYYIAAEIFEADGSSSVYDFARQKKQFGALLHQINPDIQHHLLFSFINPPHTLWLLPLMNHGGFFEAHCNGSLVMAIVAAALIFFSFYPTLRGGLLGEKLAIVALILGSPYFMFGLGHGQFSLLISAGMALFLYGWREHHRSSLTLGLVLLSIKPQFVLFPLCLMLALPWRLWRAPLFTAAALFLVTSLTFGWAIWEKYVFFLMDQMRQPEGVGQIITHMANLRGLLLHVLPQSYAPLINQSGMLIHLCVAAMAAMCWWHLRHRQYPPPLLWLYGCLSLWIGLFFTAWLHHQDLWQASVLTTMMFILTKHAPWRTAVLLITLMGYGWLLYTPTALWAPLAHNAAMIVCCLIAIRLQRTSYCSGNVRE